METLFNQNVYQPSSLQLSCNDLYTLSQHLHWVIADISILLNLTHTHTECFMALSRDGHALVEKSSQLHKSLTQSFLSVKLEAPLCKYFLWAWVSALVMPAEVWWVPKVQSPCLKASAPQHTRSLQPYSEPLCEQGCLLKPLDETLLLVALTSAQLDNITVRMQFLTSVLWCTLPCTRDRRPCEVLRTQRDEGWHRSEQVFQWGLLSRWHQKIRCWISLTSLCVVDSLKFRTALMPESFSTDKRVHFCCWLSAKYSVNFLMH